MIEKDVVKKIVVFAVTGCVVGAFIAVNMDDEIKGLFKWLNYLKD